jgi:DNA invertase Pin-like site-specific DNA recombinase
MYSEKVSERATSGVAVYERRACVGVRDRGRARGDESIEYCLRQFGVTPIVLNDDGRSGCDPDRPGLRKLMADITARKIKALIVRDVSALSRDLAHLVLIIEELKSYGVELHSVRSGGVLNGRLVLTRMPQIESD